MDDTPTQALRARDPDLLRRGLVALLRSDVDTWESDWRDLLVALAPYHDCARRLGLDVAAEFDAAAAAGPPSIAEHVRAFGRRKDVTPSAFFFAVEREPGGPRYRRLDWPGTR